MLYIRLDTSRDLNTGHRHQTTYFSNKLLRGAGEAVGVVGYFLLGCCSFIRHQSHLLIYPACVIPLFQASLIFHHPS